MGLSKYLELSLYFKNIKLSICAFMQTKDPKTFIYQVLVKSITRKSSLFGKSAKVSQKNAKNRLAVIFLAFFPLRPYRQISIPVAIKHDPTQHRKCKSR